jgi:hypothetical protein
MYVPSSWTQTNKSKPFREDDFKIKIVAYPANQASFYQQRAAICLAHFREK